MLRTVFLHDIKVFSHQLYSKSNKHFFVMYENKTPTPFPTKTALPTNLADVNFRPVGSTSPCHSDLPREPSEYGQASLPQPASGSPLLQEFICDIYCTYLTHCPSLYHYTFTLNSVCVFSRICHISILKPTDGVPVS